MRTWIDEESDRKNTETEIKPSNQISDSHSAKLIEYHSAAERRQIFERSLDEV